MKMLRTISPPPNSKKQRPPFGVFFAFKYLYQMKNWLEICTSVCNAVSCRSGSLLSMMLVDLYINKSFFFLFARLSPNFNFSYVGLAQHQFHSTHPTAEKVINGPQCASKQVRKYSKKQLSKYESKQESKFASKQDKRKQVSK